MMICGAQVVASWHLQAVEMPGLSMAMRVMWCTWGLGSGGYLIHLHTFRDLIAPARRRTPTESCLGYKLRLPGV